MIQLNKKITNQVVMVLILVFAFSRSRSQDFSAALAKADTARFINQRTSGWKLYNSYVSQEQKDSVTWEVIIQHDKKSIDWGTDQFIGQIKDKTLLPVKDLRVQYSLLRNSYVITITAKGKCFIRLAGGSLPPYDPVVLPVRIKYPNK